MKLLIMLRIMDLYFRVVKYMVDNSVGVAKDLAEGITVLPLALTKGLEFDAVVLYNPSRNRYADFDRDAKLLYVAVTRALHELHLVYTGELCELLK